MFEYTYKNHFMFGYEPDRFFCNRQSGQEVFIAKYGRSERSLSSWREANIQACVDIHRKCRGPIWVLFSGGVDSEICVRSFLEARVPIKIATLKFQNGLNEHDISYVKRFENKFGVESVYFELDLEKFWTSPEFYRLVDHIQCVSPILACHLWLADQLDGTPIIGQGEPHLKKEVPEDYVPGESPYMPSPWMLVESERLCSLYKHFIFQNRAAVPGFYQYLPEQFYSYLKFNPFLEDLVNNRVVGKLGTRTSKNKIAYQFYPEIQPREKQTGFEFIQGLHDHKRAELALRFPHSDANFYIGYQELLNQLKPRE